MSNSRSSGLRTLQIPPTCTTQTEDLRVLLATMVKASVIWSLIIEGIYTRGIRNFVDSSSIVHIVLASYSYGIASLSNFGNINLLMLLRNSCPAMFLTSGSTKPLPGLLWPLSLLIIIFTFCIVGGGSGLPFDSKVFIHSCGWIFAGFSSSSKCSIHHMVINSFGSKSQHLYKVVS